MAPCLPKGDREQARACLLWRFLEGGCSTKGNEFRKATWDTWIIYTVTVKSHENELRDIILPWEPPVLNPHKTLARALECSTGKSKEELPASMGRNIRTLSVIRLLIYTEILIEADKSEGLWSCSFWPTLSVSVLWRKSHHRCSLWQDCLMSYSMWYKSLGE